MRESSRHERRRNDYLAKCAYDAALHGHTQKPLVLMRTFLDVYCVQTMNWVSKRWTKTAVSQANQPDLQLSLRTAAKYLVFNDVARDSLTCLVSISDDLKSDDCKRRATTQHEEACFLFDRQALRPTVVRQWKVCYRHAAIETKAAGGAQ